MQLQSWALVAAILIVAVALFPAIVFGHGWYPPECCSDRDCIMLNSDRIKESGSGFTIILDDQQYFVPHHKTRPSPDGAYHGCVSAAKSMICFFVPPRGV